LRRKKDNIGIGELGKGSVVISKRKQRRNLNSAHNIIIILNSKPLPLLVFFSLSLIKKTIKPSQNKTKTTQNNREEKRNEYGASL